MTYNFPRLGRDTIPEGYLTLYECARTLRLRETGNPAIVWRAMASDDNGPEIIAELASELRREKRYADTLKKAFANGHIMACARDPASHDVDRVPRHWWNEPDFPPFPFVDRPHTASPQSRSARYNGRTLIVSEAKFENWWAAHKREGVNGAQSPDLLAPKGELQKIAADNQRRGKRPSDKALRVWAVSLTYSGKSVPNREEILLMMRRYFGRFTKDRDAARALKKAVWPESAKAGRRSKHT